MLRDDMQAISVDDHVIEDHYAIRNRDLIGVDKIMWEADFPHNDSNWPNSRKILADALVDVPDDEARRIVELNARELYRFPRS
jgi:predicted TIM-barrel fold metal-dependent hydrolase